MIDPGLASVFRRRELESVPGFKRSEFLWSLVPVQVTFYIVTRSEVPPRSVMKLPPFHPIECKRVDLLDTTLVARTVEDRGRQWNAEKPYRS
jgi:hypothetical protein